MMRYFSVVKFAAMLAAVLAVSLLAMAPVEVRAEGAENPFQYPGYTARTCSGAVSGPGIERHVFGFRGSGNRCSTRVIYSNNYQEALECARASCPDCDVIEDITGTVKFGSAVEGLELLKEYCREK